MSTEPLSADVLEAAAAWFLRTRGETLGEADRMQFQRWLDAHPHHRLAWLRATALASALDTVPRGAASRALSKARPPKRRQVRKVFTASVLIVLGLTALCVTAQRVERPHVLETAHGERSAFLLSDGTRLTLETDTHAVSRYGPRERTLELDTGELRVETAPDKALVYRPFVVQTPFARLTALGTVFNVRVAGASGSLVVLEGRVRVEPREGDGPPPVIGPGDSAAFTPSGVEPSAGQTLIANDMPLCDFVRELARYRRPVLTCDRSVEGLRISGAFPMKNGQAVLDSLPLALPVRLRSGADGSVRVAPR